MDKRTLVILLLVAAGVGGFVFLNRAPEPAVAVAGTAAAPLKLDAPAQAAAAMPTDASPDPATVTADDVARWTRDASGGDADKRAAAIRALANAPVEQALPVLRHVLMNGEPGMDRPAALQSLRDLALNQGDPNSAIRNVIREAIYHGDDQTKTSEAQEALDVIEESELK